MEILLPEGTYRRVARELERIAPAASFVLVRDDGILLRDGREVAIADLQIEVAWASRDLYVLEEPVAIREFMIAILKSENVRWMHSGGAGTDHPIFASISKKGVRLTNSDSGAIAIAEYVLAGVLDFYQPGSPRRSLQLAGQWQSTPFREICETTWLVIGLGNIGREVALRARAFGAQVIGVRRTPTGDEPVAELISPDEVAAHLPRADVIVLCAALNASTRHLVDAQFLSALRPEALLVNIARGGMIDEAALLESLDRGRPERALLDVFETEPLPAESPFWNHPRVRMTAHCAAAARARTPAATAGFWRTWHAMCGVKRCRWSSIPGISSRETAASSLPRWPPSGAARSAPSEAGLRPYAPRAIQRPGVALPRSTCQSEGSGSSRSSQYTPK